MIDSETRGESRRGGGASRATHLPPAVRDDAAFFIGDMVPTCIDEDPTAAAVMRRTLGSYVRLTNYQDYWIEAGYEDEMLAIRQAIARGDDDRLPALMSDRWLRDVPRRDDGSRWRRCVAGDGREDGDRGAVASTRGGQMVAFEALIAAFR